jgi:hypothetical protein
VTPCGHNGTNCTNWYTGTQIKLDLYFVVQGTSARSEVDNEVYTKLRRLVIDIDFWRP